MHPIALLAALLGAAITFFACGAMVAAGVVLVLHNPRFLRVSSIQIVPALVALVAGLSLP